MEHARYRKKHTHISYMAYINHSDTKTQKRKKGKQKKKKNLLQTEPRVIFSHFNPISSLTENSRIDIRKMEFKQTPQYLHMHSTGCYCVACQNFQNIQQMCDANPVNRIVFSAHRGTNSNSTAKTNHPE